MSLELFTKQLEEITEKIHQLELQETKENFIKRPDIDICLQRKATWKTLKGDIDRKRELVKSELIANPQDRKQLVILVNK